MNSSRIEAFSDGVLAIVITIQVLAMKVPLGDSFFDLLGIFPSFASYVTSFLYVAIYWNNHHHLLKNCKLVNAKMLWANMHFLFWISLLPFASDWINIYKTSKYPVAVYTSVLFFTAIAYYILQQVIVKSDDTHILKDELGKDLKNKFSILVYLICIIFAFINPSFSRVLTFFVATLWFIPDKRLEKAFNIGNKNN